MESGIIKELIVNKYNPLVRIPAVIFSKLPKQQKRVKVIVEYNSDKVIIYLKGE